MRHRDAEGGPSAPTQEAAERRDAENGVYAEKNGGDAEKTALREKDAMTCRYCHNEERASEGYPCVECGTFICVMCSFRGIVTCRKCVDSPQGKPSTPPQEIPLIDWPEH